MNVVRRVVFRTPFGLLAIFALGLVCLYLTPQARFLLYIIVSAEKEQARKVRLLSKTDHVALLEACRELLRQVSEGKLERNRYFVRIGPSPEASQFPQIVLDLDPLAIDTASTGYLIVEMAGGMQYYGVVAYSEEFQKPSPHFVYGDKKIIDGLWYREPEYNPKLDKWVQKQLERNMYNRDDKGGMP